jgi:hypothetical protein
MKSDTKKSWQQKLAMTNPSNTTLGWNLAEHNKLFRGKDIS